MKYAAFLVLMPLILLSFGCRSERIDVSSLTPKDMALFAKAAAIEGVDVTTHSEPWELDWRVVYDPSLPVSAVSKIRFVNMSRITSELPVKPFCKIRINPDKLLTCRTGSTDHYFMVVVRHELRHCEEQNNDHSSDPKDLMFFAAPCFPFN